MIVTDIYPNPADFIAMELRVLDFLRDQPFIAKNYSELTADLTKYFGVNKAVTSRFEFFSYLTVCHDQLRIKRVTGKKQPNVSIIISADIRLTDTGEYS